MTGRSDGNPWKLPGDLLRRPARESARLIVLAALEDSRQAKARLDRGADFQALHDFRVALRRLRSYLRAYRHQLRDTIPRRLTRRIRDLARATNRSRDLEVQQDWIIAQEKELERAHRKGCDWLVGHLEEQHRAAGRELGKALQGQDERIVRRLRRGLCRWGRPAGLPLHAAEPAMAVVLPGLIGRAADRLSRRLAHLRTLEDQREAHRARIAAKHLRYLLEPYQEELFGVADLVLRLKQLQNALGDLRDARLLGVELRRAMTELPAESTQPSANGPPVTGVATPRNPPDQISPGLLALHARLQHRARRAYAALRSGWLDGAAAAFFQRIPDLVREVERGPGGRTVAR